MNIISKIQNIFFEEAKNSPMLLSDLANMERYIAESYNSRSLIELLQNADDSKANKFYITVFKDSIIVANDGRVFNQEDVLSICRSGASTKKRDGKTIGYRGIGFKSVINLAEIVHILSGDFKMSFSKELTNKLIQGQFDVPLIRIPHEYSPTLVYEKKIIKLKNKGYNTIFIFEKSKVINLNEEIQELDSNLLLFLKNIKEIQIDTENSNKIIANKINNKYGEVISITNKFSSEKWLVVRDKNINSIAFLLNENDEISLVDNKMAVVHSFMPTKDEIGIPLKINGDFSTDPSRTKIVFDQISKKTLDDCSKLLISMIKNYIEDSFNYKYKGLFNVLNNFKKNNTKYFTSNIKIKDYFFENMNNMLLESNWFKGIKSDKISKKPQWLNNNDFKKICNYLGLIPIDIETEKKYPGILKFIEVFDMKSVSFEEMLKVINNVEKISIKGRVEFICEFIRRYRFKYNNETKKHIKNTNLVCFCNEKSSLNLDNKLKFDNNFYVYLKENINDINDFIWFIKLVFGDLSEEILKVNNLFSNEKKSNVKYKSKEENLKHDIRKILPTVNKWRSVEINLSNFLRKDKNIKKVIDVSKSNLGYDLEIYYNNGAIKYIEVKSVENLGTTISLTNNEYSTANELKDNYLIAIVKQTNDGMNVCYIENPIYNLNLIKRVTRWEWICDEYNGKYLDYFFDEERE